MQASQVLHSTAQHLGSSPLVPGKEGQGRTAGGCLVSPCKKGWGVRTGIKQASTVRCQVRMGPPQQASCVLPVHAGRQQRSHGPCAHMSVRLAKPPVAHESGMLPVRALLLSRSVVSWGKPPDPHAGGSDPMKLWPLRESEASDLQCSQRETGGTISQAAKTVEGREGLNRHHEAGRSTVSRLQLQAKAVQ